MSSVSERTDEREIDFDSLTVEAPHPGIDKPAYETLLGLADDELVIGHRHSEWLGLSPFLEEDLTMASIAQDEFGHARSLYAVIWPDWDDRDASIVRRPASSWRSCPLVEMPGLPWERSLVRHLLYDMAETYRWQSAVDEFGAEVAGLSALCEKVLQEERFHARHATELVKRLARNDDGRARLQSQLDVLTPLVGALVASVSADALSAFNDELMGFAESVGLRVEVASFGDVDRSTRSADFEMVQRALLDVYAFDPSARW